MASARVTLKTSAVPFRDEETKHVKLSDTIQNMADELGELRNGIALKDAMIHRLEAENEGLRSVISTFRAVVEAGKTPLVGKPALSEHKE